MTSTRHQCCQSVALYLITANNVGQRLVSNSGQFELGHSLILVNLSLGTKSLQWNVGCGRECSKGGMGRYGTPFILMIPECRGKSTTVIVAICSPQHRPIQSRPPVAPWRVARHGQMRRQSELGCVYVRPCCRELGNRRYIWWRRHGMV